MPPERWKQNRAASTGQGSTPAGQSAKSDILARRAETRRLRLMRPGPRKWHLSKMRHYAKYGNWSAGESESRQFLPCAELLQSCIPSLQAQTARNPPGKENALGGSAQQALLLGWPPS